MSPTSTAVVLLAAGAGRRVGAQRNKVLLELGGLPVLAHSVRTVLSLEDVTRIVVVVRPEDRDEVAAALAPHLGTHDVWLVDGGTERHDSETRALEALRPEIEAGELAVVAIHDAARPLASADLFRAVIAAATTYGAAVPAVPAAQLSLADGSLAEHGLAAVQTPQAFRARDLARAYAAAAADGFVGTDTAASLERYTDVVVHAVDGEPANLKVTFPEDLALVSELLQPSSG